MKSIVYEREVSKRLEIYPIEHIYSIEVKFDDEEEITNVSFSNKTSSCNIIRFKGTKEETRKLKEDLRLFFCGTNTKHYKSEYENLFDLNLYEEKSEEAWENK